MRKRTEREIERLRRAVLTGKVLESLASEGEWAESGDTSGGGWRSRARRYQIELAKRDMMELAIARKGKGVNVGTKGPGKGIAGEGDEQYGVATSTSNGLWRKPPLTCSVWKACVRYLVLRPS